MANLAVLTYFIAALFSRQYIIPGENDEYVTMEGKVPASLRGHGTFPNSSITYSSSGPFSGHTPDIVFPFFTIIELICYMGWIQVAESLLNPFGGLLNSNFKKIYITI